MVTDGTHQGGSDGVTRFRDVIEHEGHAWVLARDDADYFFECLKCHDRVHLLSVARMEKAIEHNYAHVATWHRAPWNQGAPRRVFSLEGGERVEHPEPYPPCTRRDEPVPNVRHFAAGPLVAVPQHTVTRVNW